MLLASLWDWNCVPRRIYVYASSANLDQQPFGISNISNKTATDLVIRRIVIYANCWKTISTIFRALNCPTALNVCKLANCFQSGNIGDMMEWLLIYASRWNDRTHQNWLFIQGWEANHHSRNGLTMKIELSLNEIGFHFQWKWICKNGLYDVAEKLILAESVSQWKERGAKSQKR